MFTRPELTVETSVLELRNDRLARSPALLNTAFDRAIRNLRRDMVRELSTPLGAHVRPTQWQSEKQRRYWFWALKTGVIQWTGRTGTLEKGWKTDLNTSQAGGIFTVYNNVPYKTFVQGQRVQRMHQGVWPQENAVFVKYRVIAQIRLVEAWRTVTDYRAGVR